MASELLSPLARVTDANANPYSGAKWKFYESGTLTPQAVYADADLNTSLGSTVTADSGGKFVPIYFDASLSYRGICENASGSVELHDIDPINNAFYTALFASSGSSLINFIQAGTGAVARSVQAKLRERISVLDFGADPTGGSDSRAAFISAGTAAGEYGCIVVPQGEYLVSDVVTILDGQSWIFESAELYHADDTKLFFSATEVIDWAILGNVVIRGLLTVAATAAETGIYIESCDNYHVEGVTCRNFRGKGFHLAGANNPTNLRGIRGKFVNCTARDSTVGRQIDAGAGAEYSTWANWTASGNITGDKISGGNVVTIGGNIVDNTVGVRLENGSNHGHGIYSGVNINHNSSANVWATGVLNGYTFDGCHAYSNGTTTAPIWFQGCKNMLWLGGVIDCAVYNDSGTGSGLNKILFANNPGTDFALYTNNSALGQLEVRGCWGPTGNSALNDPASVYVEATRAGGTQDVSAAGTTLLFDNEISDKGANYVAGTGIFTAPVTGFYEISVALYFSASSSLVDSDVSIRKNSGDLSPVPMVAISGTQGRANGSTVRKLTAADTVQIQSTITGTSPVLVNGSSLTIRLLD